jgi:hypothetical protein
VKTVKPRPTLATLATLAMMILVCLSTTATATAQMTPTCPEPGAVVKAWHSIARQARTYALIQLPRGITQSEAIAIARTCRFRGKVGYLAEFGNADPTEWQDVRSRFGTALGGLRVENAWVAAGRETDGFVRWYQSRTGISNVTRWGAWAPNEPQAKTGVSLHAGYPGLFNSCSANDRYTRLLVEFR